MPRLPLLQLSASALFAGAICAQASPQESPEFHYVGPLAPFIRQLNPLLPAPLTVSEDAEWIPIAVSSRRKSADELLENLQRVTRTRINGQRVVELNIEKIVSDSLRFRDQVGERFAHARDVWDTEKSKQGPLTEDVIRAAARRWMSKYPANREGGDFLNEESVNPFSREGFTFLDKLPYHQFGFITNVGGRTYVSRPNHPFDAEGLKVLNRIVADTRRIVKVLSEPEFAAYPPIARTISDLQNRVSAIDFEVDQFVVNISPNHTNPRFWSITVVGSNMSSKTHPPVRLMTMNLWMGMGAFPLPPLPEGAPSKGFMAPTTIKPNASSAEDLRVLGIAGMRPYERWGRSFVDYMQRSHRDLVMVLDYATGLYNPADFKDPAKPFGALEFAIAGQNMILDEEKRSVQIYSPVPDFQYGAPSLSRRESTAEEPDWQTGTELFRHLMRYARVQPFSMSGRLPYAPESSTNQYGAAMLKVPDSPSLLRMCSILSDRNLDRLERGLPVTSNDLNGDERAMVEYTYRMGNLGDSTFRLVPTSNHIITKAVRSKKDATSFAIQVLHPKPSSWDRQGPYKLRIETFKPFPSDFMALMAVRRVPSIRVKVKGDGAGKREYTAEKLGRVLEKLVSSVKKASAFTTTIKRTSTRCRTSNAKDSMPKASSRSQLRTAKSVSSPRSWGMQNHIEFSGEFLTGKR